MKKVLTIFSTLFLTSFVTAYSSQGSLQDILNQLDPSTAILGSMFLIFFILINFALSKAFKGQKGIAGILAFIVSFLAIYVINRSGVDYYSIYYDLFDNIGLSSEIGSTILPIILMIGFIILFVKFGIGVLLITIGGFIFAYGSLFAYEKFATMVIGAVIGGIGAYLESKKKTKK